MARIPDNTRIYAIGDIHGRADLLAALLGQIEADDKARPPAATRLVFLGDYIDRGPDSYGVIELLLKGLPAGMGADFLMGNHERMMLDALAEEWRMPLWLSNGGGAAVLSYTRAARERGENAGPLFFGSLRLIFIPSADGPSHADDPTASPWFSGARALTSRANCRASLRSLCRTTIGNAGSARRSAPASCRF